MAEHPTAAAASATDASEPTQPPAKQAKIVYCESCGYSLNSEAQAAAHYSGKSHLKRLKQLKYGTQDTPYTRPYRPHPMKSAANWGVAQPTSQWSPISPPQRKTRFGPSQSNIGVTFNVGLSYESYQSSAASSLSGFPSFPSNRQVSYPSAGGYPDAGYQNNAAPYGQFIPAEPEPNPVAKAVMDNFLGILPTKKRRSVVHCSVCGLTFNSESQGNAHFQGSKHKRKVMLANGALTPVQDEPKETSAAAPPPVSSNTPPNATLLWCDICRISVNSQKQLDAHYQGQNHKNKVIAAGSGHTEAKPWTEVPGCKGGWFFCNTCDISVPTADALRKHVLSPDHLDKKNPGGP